MNKVMYLREFNTVSVIVRILLAVICTGLIEMQTLTDLLHHLKEKRNFLEVFNTTLKWAII